MHLHVINNMKFTFKCHAKSVTRGTFFHHKVYTKKRLLLIVLNLNFSNLLYNKHLKDILVLLQIAFRGKASFDYIGLILA